MFFYDFFQNYLCRFYFLDIELVENYNCSFPHKTSCIATVFPYIVFFCFDYNLLKIWSMNKFTRGPRCLQLPRSSTERKNAFHQTTTKALTGTIRGRDVHLIIEAATDPNWDDNCAFYYHRTGELITLPYNATFPVSLSKSLSMTFSL